ncbi:MULTISPECIES: DUF1294 domain-containing protein [Sporosarcina]|uniref:DUF1294 domain-containing protein n=1 Tax=Sporosarcina TaxID=1569 RepID=UPI0005904A07|nr:MULTISPECIES: DUF1294 domain-containing protein [Sporosarcina]WJY27997.1 DUF1294 domain-containing protein [Sporosarcina sp. 0.2-SM1T-5]
MEVIALAWVAGMSVLTFVSMGYDKRQAVRRRRRVPEKRLWLFAAAGGGPGAYLGMQVFRHKTLHTQFRVGFLMLALLDAALLLYLFGFGMPALPQFS